MNLSVYCINIFENNRSNLFGRPHTNQRITLAAFREHLQLVSEGDGQDQDIATERSTPCPCARTVEYQGDMFKVKAVRGLLLREILLELSVSKTLLREGFKPRNRLAT